MNRPRVLFLTCHLPYPPISGGRRREYELITRLGGSFDIELGVVSKTYEEDRANTRALEEFCSKVELFPVHPVTTAPTSGAAAFQVLRHHSPQFTSYVRRRLADGDVDVLHVESFYMMQHVPEPAPAPILLVEQNVEYVLWRQRTEEATRVGERRSYLQEYLKTLQTEIHAWTRADLCAAVTSDDRTIMQQAAPQLDIRVIPDGIDHVGLTSTERSEITRSGRANGRVPVVAFVANFGYQPNVDAATFLLENIFPKVLARRPDAQLWLVGNGPPPEIESLGAHSDHILVTGRVPSVVPYLDAADVIVCPLRIGGGIKVKVLEALCRGKPIVTTSVGAQGLGPRAASALVIQDEPARFAHAVVRLLSRPKERRRLAASARRFALQLPTWDNAADELASAWRELVPGRWLRPPAVAETLPSSAGSSLPS